MNWKEKVSELMTTKKITQKNLAKKINCTQSCIAKKHNKILNLIKESLKY